MFSADVDAAKANTSRMLIDLDFGVYRLKSLSSAEERRFQIPPSVLRYALADLDVRGSDCSSPAGIGTWLQLPSPKPSPGPNLAFVPAVVLFESVLLGCTSLSGSAACVWYHATSFGSALEYQKCCSRVILLLLQSISTLFALGSQDLYHALVPPFVLLQTIVLGQ